MKAAEGDFHMPIIKFVQADGSELSVQTSDGVSIMEAALAGGVNGIVAECGGACSCATCHVYVDPAWVNKIPAANQTEVSMLKFVQDKQDNSRLSCQIKVDDSLDGLKLTVPAEQY